MLVTRVWRMVEDGFGPDPDAPVGMARADTMMTPFEFVLTALLRDRVEDGDGMPPWGMFWFVMANVRGEAGPE